MVPGIDRLEINWPPVKRGRLNVNCIFGMLRVGAIPGSTSIRRAQRYPGRRDCLKLSLVQAGVPEKLGPIEWTFLFQLYGLLVTLRGDAEEIMQVASHVEIDRGHPG